MEYNQLLRIETGYAIASFQNQSQTENCFKECLQFVGITEAIMQLIICKTYQSH